MLILEITFLQEAYDLYLFIYFFVYGLERTQEYSTYTNAGQHYVGREQGSGWENPRPLADSHHTFPCTAWERASLSWV